MPTQKVGLPLSSRLTAKKRAAVMALKLPVGNLSSDDGNAADEAATESTVDAKEKWDAETGV